MSERYPQVDAFILHSKPYQETSAIFQVFTKESGRISLLAKGVRNKKSQARKAILQPFNLLSLSYVGRGDLKTLVECELIKQQASNMYLNNESLACGYYLNELIIRALPEWESYSTLFELYCEAISSFGKHSLQSILRKFEVELLTELGLAPDWRYDSFEKPIESGKEYYFIDDRGFIVAEDNPEYRTSSSPVYTGKSILALSAEQAASSNEDNLKASQKLTQRLLRQVIGDRPLQSRKMWQHSRNIKK